MPTCNYIYIKVYCITPLAWVEIQCFALTVYMPTCLHVDKRAALHAYTLACVHACSHQKTTQNPPKNLPKTSQKPPKIRPRGPPKSLLLGLGRQEAPRRLQDAPRHSQEGLLEASREPPGRLGPKKWPRWLQVGSPKRSQNPS
jgi:hypothetical protein